MTQEEKELLLNLLQKANESGLLHVYDRDDVHDIEVDWIFSDTTVNIGIKII
jgi:hypothetical protein